MGRKESEVHYQCSVLTIGQHYSKICGVGYDTEMQSFGIGCPIIITLTQMFMNFLV